MGKWWVEALGASAALIGAFLGLDYFSDGTIDGCIAIGITAPVDHIWTGAIAFHGGRLRDLRRLRGWCQEELARRSGIAESTIRRAELGKCEPRDYTVWRFAQVLGVETGALYVEEEEPPREGSEAGGETNPGSIMLRLCPAFLRKFL